MVMGIVKKTGEKKYKKMNNYNRKYNAKGQRTNFPCDDTPLLEKIASFILLIAFFSLIVWITNNVKI